MGTAKPLVIAANALQQHSDSDLLVVGQGIAIAEQATSLTTPANGYGVLYCKTDGHLYFKNDSGTETQLT